MKINLSLTLLFIGLTCLANEAPLLENVCEANQKPSHINYGLPSIGKYPYLNPADGARKVFASKFQSCNVLKFAMGGNTKLNPQQFIRSEITKGSYPECSCSNALLKKKNHLDYSQADGAIKVKKNNSDEEEFYSLEVFNKRVDCSSFISASYLASGLKMSHDSKFSNYRYSTSGVMGAISKKNFCFEKIKGNIDNLILEGDLVNMKLRKTAHAVIINRVGKDPYGIKAILLELEEQNISKDEALKLCNKITTKKIDLDIIHSSRMKGRSSGITIMALKSYPYGVGKIIVKDAKKACNFFVKNGRNAIYDHAKNSISNGEAILRHKGITDPKCVFEQLPKVKGQDCLNGCFIKN